MAIRRLSLKEVLEAVVRQALILEGELTTHDVLEQIDALGRGDIVRRIRGEIEREWKRVPGRRKR
jgi:hypothetical protein